MQKERKTVSFISAVFLIVTCCIFVPSNLFLGNVDEFKINYIDIVPVIGCISLIAAVLCLVLFFLFYRINNLYITLVFGIALGCYLQSNFLNPDLGSLDGREIDWSLYRTSAVIGMIIWVLCIAGTGVLLLVKWKYSLTILKAAGLFLTAVQVVTLIVLILSAKKSSAHAIVVTKDDEFVLSHEKNTVVFVLDTMDAQWFESVILSDKEYSDKLNGFTYYSNVVAGGAPTILGMPALLTGRTFHPDRESREDYFQRASEESTFFRDLDKEEVTVKLYTTTEFMDYADIGNVKNIQLGKYKISSYYKFMKSLSKLVLFNVSPLPLKERFLIYTGDLTNRVVIDDKNLEGYLIDDPQFYSDLMEKGVEAGNEKKMLCLYHLFGAHGYYTMNEDSQRVAETRTQEGREKQIKGAFHIVFRFIDQMKEAGLYDDCTFVITADHGGVALYQNPMVLVKKPHSGEEALTIDDKEATFRNVRASIAASLLEEYGKEEYGETLEESGQSIGERHHTCDNILLKNVFPDIEAPGKYTEMVIHGSARDNESISLLPETEKE